jgi:excisionase family DNA binding protein
MANTTNIPYGERAYLTVKEAAAYFRLGETKIREMTDGKECPFVLWNGNKRLIRRKKLEDFLDQEYSI